MSTNRIGRMGGFTLIEILIVVVILGILASVVIVQVSSATADSRRTAASSSVQTLRHQITLYRVQHRDTNPPVGQVWTNLQARTDEFGNVGSDDIHKYGPYVAQEPVNPYNGLGTVADVSAPGAIPSDADLDIKTFGFLYDVETGRIWANRGN